MKTLAGTGLVRADSDLLLYKREDTHWTFEPTDEDPGWLVPNWNAVPIEDQEE